jgi:hypothetical protein
MNIEMILTLWINSGFKEKLIYPKSHFLTRHLVVFMLVRKLETFFRNQYRVYRVEVDRKNFGF